MDLAERIATFPTWHYDFEFDGVHTNPSRATWQEKRADQIIGPALKLYGGTLAGKRVLDLGCNAGFFSLKAIEAGADFVLGVDGRQLHIDQANLVFESKGIERDRHEFLCANFLEFPFDDYPPFDLILCLGVLYHVGDPIHFLRRVAAVNTDLLVVDTKLSTLRGNVLELHKESVDHLLNAVDAELVAVPTPKAVLSIAEHLGYTTKILDTIGADAPSNKYRYGLFGTTLCAKTSDLSSLPGITLDQVIRAQDTGAEIRRAKKAPPPKPSFADKLRARVPFRR